MLEILDSINMPYNSKRSGFPKFRGYVFGTSIDRCLRTPQSLSRMTRENPEQWEKIKEWSYENVPSDVEWNCIQVNKNLVCPKHNDKANVGKSFIISFGNYEGCNLVVSGIEHDTRLGLVFDGFVQEHYNTPLLSGTKYSLVFFNNNLKHFSEFE
jgi:hypothetical protein